MEAIFKIRQMATKFSFARFYRIMLIILSLFYVEITLIAQIAPNNVDTLGLKQGMWREFKIPIPIMTDYIGFKVPIDSSEYIYWTKDRDRKYFPIIECIGEYKDGLKSGVWLEYYGNGRKKSQVDYKKGVPFGDCKIYWGNGVLKKEFTISTDDSVIVKVYELNGEVIMEKNVSKIQVIKEIYEE